MMAKRCEGAVGYSRPVLEAGRVVWTLTVYAGATGPAAVDLNGVHGIANIGVNPVVA